MASVLRPRGGDSTVQLSVGSVIAIVEAAVILTALVYVAVSKGACCGGRAGRGRW